jgi:hypothetical protein
LLVLLFVPFVTLAAELRDDEERLKFIREIVDSLPAASRSQLEAIASLLSRLAAAHERTGVNSARLASLLGPLLLRPQALEYRRPHTVPLSTRVEL